ncbi:NahK/ErcS family hybrid sensor histidine kinase/response regulator [Neptuniibacter sp. 2_MG-2023]|uniref:PAS domain-containing hybrid sensor histidine kinase/response regulator n=1 Tax=Neptuniibacter sp. 2_MG-2023 TaxID=3062671 RepID=UPI0026E15697|nr:NahK/ErcS family hybrid sensor histidine kinase/response regulator [Neptuniibacter sp. 2_MG-2023]MDO6514456.1 NahK/ErcS family hybrid sensor histidine kinase/response regulator [Neptuniibacter sp. 2_MG-2023]
MKKHSNAANDTLTNLMGLGNHSVRKNYYSELVSKLDELEQEKNRYKWLFENAQHGIFQAQLDGGILNANPAIVHICGYVSSKEFCDTVTDLESLLFCCVDAYEDFRYNLVQSGKVSGFETIFLRADGQCIHVSINALLKDNQGEHPTIEAFIKDITERKKTEGQLKQLNEELELRVTSRTQELVSLNNKLWQEISDRERAQKELQIAKEAAEEANRGKDKYLAAASHDLLQPMNAARLLISALRERSLPQQDGHLVERVHMALENAEDLLTDLLDISKLDQNAVTLDVSCFRLDHLLHSMVSEFQPVAEDKGIELRLQSSSVVVKSDSRLLLRIIRNLISNAIRYTPAGKVLVGCRRKKDVIRIQVLDTGIGIPDNKLDAIFKEFNQLDTPNAKDRQGVGLGLAIVERIATILGHDLSVRSVEGKGSIFSVDVPFVEHFSDSPELTPLHPPQINMLHDLSILVIDNEENILVSMDALLSQWGCSIITASSAEEALILCQDEEFTPDVILADYHLDNGLLGTDGIAQIRENYSSLIPALILTADRSSESGQMFKEMGLPVINKPVKPSKLRALLTHLCQ